MISISFFNNKGGVGKTTLTCNIASIFSKEFKKRVLVVDCDPQCNSTLLILGEDKTIPIYWKEKNNSNLKDSDKISTLSDVLKPLEVGDSSINGNFEIISSEKNRFLVDLLPGHPRVSIMEERLAQAWRDASGGEIGGLRQTNWVNLLCDILAERYDTIFFDLGPSLGSLNRTCLIGTDFFMTPMGADIFSMVGLKNISEWIQAWIKDYYAAIENCDRKFPNTIDTYKLKRKLNIEKGFAGYTVQAYIAKFKAGEKRPTKAFENIIDQFPIEIERNLASFMRDGLEPRLGEIPNMYSLVPLAQTVASPIWALNAADGLVGTHFSQAKKYDDVLKRISQNLATNIGLELN